MELANSIVTLQPGMYILRHPKTGMPPISISKAAVSAKHNGQIQALYTPGTDGAVLRDGKDCIVMQVLYSPVDLLVTAYLDKAGAAVPTLKIDKIRLDSEADTPQALQIAPKGISLIGHIEARGDVAAAPGQTLGEPNSNLRLEGFQVMWPDKPPGIELQYGGRVEGTHSSPLVSTGEFSGTRNSAKRLIEVRFDLAGPRTDKFQLSGTAHFSGGFMMPIERGMRLAGPTGMEHLTAISLTVSPLQRPANSNPWEQSQRTRIMKASQKDKK